MIADFRHAVAFVLKEEGGYTNDPVDQGGATNKIDSTTVMVSHWHSREVSANPISRVILILVERVKGVDRTDGRGSWRWQSFVGDACGLNPNRGG
jgi:hypothetical protein